MESRPSKWIPPKHKSDDPDIYVLLINYHVKKGIKEVLVLEQGTPDSGMQTIMLEDQKTGKEVGFMGSRMEVDTNFIVKDIGTEESKSLARHLGSL